jgi:hypothetical protein
MDGDGVYAAYGKLSAETAGARLGWWASFSSIVGHYDSEMENANRIAKPLCDRFHLVSGMDCGSGRGAICIAGAGECRRVFLSMATVRCCGWAVARPRTSNKRPAKIRRGLLRQAGSDLSFGL